MIEFASSNMHDYLDRHAHDRASVFTEMESIARRLDFPIVGPLVGQFFYCLVRLSGAKEVFEIGSGFGYSALWFAAALPRGGKVTCTEFNPENIRRGKEYAKRLKVTSKIEFYEGDGKELLGKSRKKYDIIFNDGQKEDYPGIIGLALKKLRYSGMLISDNVLWSGRVAGEEDDKATESIREYNRLIFSTSGLRSSIIPLRDGVAVSVKE